MAKAINPQVKNSKKDVKAAEPQVEIKKTVNPLDAITAKLPAIVKAGKSTSSIYKAELFDGQDEKGKKSIRRKVRRIRDQFLGAYLEAKNKPESLKKLQKDWKEFASQVYTNSSFIFEKNTAEDDQKLCQEFVKAMAADYTK